MFLMGAIFKSGTKMLRSCICNILSCPLAERGAKRASPLAGCDHSPDHAVRATGHPGGVFPRPDSTEEAPVGGHIQPQLTGGGWCQAGDGQRPQSAPGGEADLRSATLPHSLYVKGGENTRSAVSHCWDLLPYSTMKEEDNLLTDPPPWKTTEAEASEVDRRRPEAERDSLLIAQDVLLWGGVYCQRML